MRHIFRFGPREEGDEMSTVTTYGIGGFDPTKPNGNIVEEVEVEVDDPEPVEQAADRGRVLTKAEQAEQADLADAVAANEAWVKSRKGTVGDQVAALTTQVNKLMRTQLPE